MGKLLHLNVSRPVQLGVEIVPGTGMIPMRDILFKVLVVAAVVGVAKPTHANVLVNDTWQDGTRTDPTAANGYAENNGVVGTDADNDGDLESAWFNTGGTMTASPSNLVTTLPPNGTSSASW